ncbi:lantibiotic dehydratase [Streptomyces mangrovi]|uniref:lantibiotic dehydratase n=1 Tax=Streptomyces mangrovi TaxID=1206892 RepID=UPI00399D2EA5
MVSRSAVNYQWQGAAMLRATTNPNPADLPRTLDVDDPAVAREWLTRIWRREEVRQALRVATPALCGAIEAVIRGTQAHPRQVRKAALSAASYLLRWQHRPTPLGLFAGTAPVSVGSAPLVRWGAEHRVAVRADAEWVTDVILRLQESPALLRRLPLVANNAARERGDRLVAPGPPADGRARLPAPVEISVRNTRPVAAAMRAARRPVVYDDLHAHLRSRFPRAAAEQIDALLGDLVTQHFLITSLWAPMTTADSFAHLCAELERLNADTAPGIGELVRELYAVRDEMAGHQSDFAAPVSEGVVARMRALSPVTPTPLLIDTALDCEVRIPQSVMDEVQAAVAGLYRTTPQPYGYQHWRDYHRRFRARYGVGALVPVMDLVSDSGLGLPAGYVGAERGRAPKPLTDRDEAILALVQQVLMEGRGELLLTDATIDALARAAGGDERMFVPRVEVAFEIHAPSTAALARGEFQLVLTGVPRPGSSMAGRFSSVLPPDQQDALAATYRGTADAITAQLSFVPRRRRNENVTRTPQLLPHVIELSGHRGADDQAIALADIAVTADARSLHLVQLSTGRRIDVRVPHALEAGTQTPPLARFLAEVATARYAAYKPFDYGAAARLPYLPRVRYRRTVLTPARWLLATEELPGRTASAADWERAFEAWRDRLRVPEAVAVVEHDQRLPVDLTHPVHRRMLRARLDHARILELREVPDGDARGWIGRAHEVWVSLGRTRPEDVDPGLPRPVAVVSAGQERHLPGAGSVLYAHLHAHPRRYDEILTRHLPSLLAEFGDAPPLWWFTRHRETSRPEADQYLALAFHPTFGTYGRAAEHVHAWADSLHRTGLASDLALAGYRPQTGRYGHDEAMDAAHRVFASDSAAALAQIRLTIRTDAVNPQALAAASLLDLTTHFAPSQAEGTEWLVRNLPQGTGRLDRRLRDQVLVLTAPDGPSYLATLADGAEVAEVAEAWRARATALEVYRKALARQREPLGVTRSLLHQHHVRALGVSPSAEAVTLRLARTAALRHQKAVR